MTVRKLRDELDHLVREGYGDKKIEFNLLELHIRRHPSPNPGVYAARIDRVVGATTTTTDQSGDRSCVTAYPVIPDWLAEANKGTRW
ncbi:hypothetical protein [Corynebacterium glyciniphilum]|uniref:hypothetical protein n=1 Tax=Corynebacterium glyciniphilum TaxID=1404244 RepID=UPI003FD2BD32